MRSDTELRIIQNIERQLMELSLRSPVLCELPIAPLRGIADLVRLELALARFAVIHRSKRSKILINGVCALLGEARARLQSDTSINNMQSLPVQDLFADTQPVA